MAHDHIYSINGVRPHNSYEATQAIVGPPESVVEVVVKRRGVLKKLFVMRELKDHPDVYRYIIDDIGYLNLDVIGGENFSQSIIDAFVDFQKNRIKTIILDLRGNPGGYTNSAVEFIGSFFPQKIAVYKNLMYKLLH